MKCEICNKEVNGTKGLSIHLSKNHKEISMKNYYDKYLKKENEGKCYFCENNAIFFNLTKGYHKICNSKECLGKTRATGTYRFLMYKYNLSKDDSIKLMNERSLDRGKKIKNSLDKKLSENSNFHKEKSHQTKEYWIKRGLSEGDAINKAKEVIDNIHLKTWKKRRDNPELYKDINTSQIKYWIKKGYTKEEAKKKISERQRTFTFEKCIEKYGEVKGLEVWNEKQRRWSEKIEKKYKNGDFQKFKKDMTSTPENEIFDIVTEKLNIKEKSFYGKNQFYRTFKDIGRTFSYDFVYGKKVIEFNGDYWHCNPKFYNKNYFHKYLQMIAEEIWKNDEIKNDKIIEEGYDVLVIWENDYKNNKEKIVQDCIDFLNKKE
jgi:uncharacterized protein YaeQ